MYVSGRWPCHLWTEYFSGLILGLPIKESDSNSISGRMPRGVQFSISDNSTAHWTLSLKRVGHQDEHAENPLFVLILVLPIIQEFGVVDEQIHHSHNVEAEQLSYCTALLMIQQLVWTKTGLRCVLSDHWTGDTVPCFTWIFYIWKFLVVPMPNELLRCCFNNLLHCHQVVRK